MSNVEDKYYAYFFTRQDIFPEYQLVQTAHAALKLGYYMGIDFTKSCDEIEEDMKDKKILVPYNITDPDETYFTVVGVRDVIALEAVKTILDKFGFKYEEFSEPDIGNELTSIAVYPINEKDKGVLMAFNLLKFNKKG